VDTLNIAEAQPKRRDRGRPWRRAMLAALVLVVLGVGFQAVHIHHQDGHWALVPSVAPDRLRFSGRDYERGDLDTKVYTNWEKRGTTSGGGTILTLASTTGTPTVLWVRKGDKVWGYGLIGGP